MISKQETLNLSPYYGIVRFIIPKDNMLRQINDQSAGLFGMEIQGATTIFGLSRRALQNLSGLDGRSSAFVIISLLKWV